MKIDNFMKNICFFYTFVEISVKIVFLFIKGALFSFSFCVLKYERNRLEDCVLV